MKPILLETTHVYHFFKSMSNVGIDLRKERTNEKYWIEKIMRPRESQPKEAQSVVVEKKENKNCNN